MNHLHRFKPPILSFLFQRKGDEKLKDLYGADHARTAGVAEGVNNQQCEQDQGQVGE
jgi:hypothetical protein